MRWRLLKKFYKLQVEKNKIQEKIIDSLSMWIPNYYITDYVKWKISLPEWIKEEEVYILKDKKVWKIAILMK